MKFDIIIGNPPYQMNDGSGGSTDAAMPVYNKFIESAINLSPAYLMLIIPSKWMVGGRGLQKFRENMLNESRIKNIYDFEDASFCFPGVHIDGGVCYFLWEQAYHGKVNYTYTSKNSIVTKRSTYLKNNYFDYVIRDGRILSILDKTAKDERFSKIVSNTKPFGIRKDLFNANEKYPAARLSEEKFKGSVKIYGVKGLKGGAKRTSGYISSETVTSSLESIHKYKLFFTTTYSTDAIIPPEIILGNPGEVCTETFLLIGPYDSSTQQRNCLSYMQTNFFRVLLYFGKGTMQVTKSVFGLIPLQNFDEPWTDEKLYQKYGLNKEEIDFIESMIKPME